MNEVIFFGFTLFLLVSSLVAFKAGKSYVFSCIVAYSLLMNIFVTKQFELFGLVVTGGNAFYGVLFLLTDLLSEHYGKYVALRAVTIGFLVTLIFVISTQVLLAYMPTGDDFAHEHLLALFSLSPRILAGSLLAYAIAQTIDVILFQKLKKLTSGRFLFLRNNGSTMISQLIDSFIFTLVGLTTFSFAPGVISYEIFWEVVLATYIIKLVVAVMDTPFLYLSYYFLPDTFYSNKQFDKNLSEGNDYE